MRSVLKSIDRAMSAKVNPSICIANEPNCGHGPIPTPSPHRVFTGATNLSNVPSYYAGRRIIGPSIPPAIDSYGAHMNGYATSASQYVINGLGQNGTTVTSANVGSFGYGTFQYGTTTFTIHSTLPMARYTDPVFGSGVVYYDPPSSQMRFGSTSYGANTYYGTTVQYPTTNPTKTQLIDIGIAAVGIIIGAVAIIAGAGLVAVASPVEIAIGLALAVVGLAVGIFGLIDQLLELPQIPTIQYTVPGSAQLLSGGDGPPDGLGTTGFSGSGYADGGGGTGTDEYEVA